MFTFRHSKQKMHQIGWSVMPMMLQQLIHTADSHS